jgi:uncharacterized protein (DUF433 family)
MEDVWVVSDPEVCGGKPIIRGTRIPVEFIIRMLKQGYTIEQIHNEYPSIPLEVIREIKTSIEKRKSILVEIKA